MKKRICIVGSAPSSRDLVPYDDKGIEIWTLMQRKEKRSDLVFEIHCKEQLTNDRLKNNIECYNYYKNNPPVISIEKNLPIKNKQQYPLKEAQEFVKKHKGSKDYIMSSIGYMIIYAILQNVDEISIYGVDMKGSDEYAYQRSNCEWLLGIASGMGIKIYIPEKSALLKSAWRYGTKESIGLRTGDLSYNKLIERHEKHEKGLKDLHDNLMMLQGGYKTLQYLKSITKDGIITDEQLKQNIALSENSFREQETLHVIQKGVVQESQNMVDMARNEKLGGV